MRTNWPGGDRELVWGLLAGDGSDRKFFRVSGGQFSAVALAGPDAAENRAYDLIGRHLWLKGGWGPEFLSSDREKGFFLLEDLGDRLLQAEALASGAGAAVAVYRPVVRLLAEVHARALDGFDPAWPFQTRRYDRELILQRETGYFLSAFVSGYLGLSPDRPGLDAEFAELAGKALAGTETVLMHRDFQSRNIMIKDALPRLVDFQGARLGPPGYDLASLLYDPYVRLGPEERRELFSQYLKDRADFGYDLDETAFRVSFRLLAVCRLLQALGAFGFLSRVKGKRGFEAYIPAALEALEGLMAGNEMNFINKLRGLLTESREKLEKPS